MVLKSLSGLLHTYMHDHPHPTPIPTPPPAFSSATSPGVLALVSGMTEGSLALQAPHTKALWAIVLVSIVGEMRPLQALPPRVCRQLLRHCCATAVGSVALAPLPQQRHRGREMMGDGGERQGVG